MANNKQDSLYNPDRKPDSTIAKPSVDVNSNTSADSAITPGATEGETLEQAIARVATLREKRSEWGAFAQKLALPERPGYHRHWFNDVAGRIDEATAAGWSHVINPRDGKPLNRVVGTGRDNNALRAFAMELPEIFWKEEMDARHADAKARVDAIKKNPFPVKPGESKASDQGKFYSPTDAAPLQVVKG